MVVALDAVWRALVKGCCGFFNAIGLQEIVMVEICDQIDRNNRIRVIAWGIVDDIEFLDSFVLELSESA